MWIEWIFWLHIATTLADHLIPASDAAPCQCCLRSANRNCLTVPCCWLSMYDCRDFHYTGPTVWNSLPDELINPDSFDSFERFLKTILFSVTSALEVFLMHYINLHFIYLLSYLHLKVFMWNMECRILMKTRRIHLIMNVSQPLLFLMSTFLCEFCWCLPLILNLCFFCHYCYYYCWM